MAHILDTMVTDRKPGTFYNASDLNRVEIATKFIYDFLIEYGYMSAVEIKTNWTKTDIPTPAQMERYCSNIKRLIDGYAVLPTTPPLPSSLQKLDYRGANDIEQVLIDLHIVAKKMAAAMRYSGQFYSGE